MEQMVAVFLTWIGQACFLINAGDTIILIDPVPTRMGYYSEQVEADFVLVSHEHGDHSNVAMAKEGATVLRGLKGGGQSWNQIDGQYDGVKIRSISTYHDAAEGSQRGLNTMFLIEAEGTRILHTGDLGHVLSDETVKEVGEIDVLLICVGGHFTIGPDEAKQVIDQLKPRVVVPMHYKTDKTPNLPITGPEEFVEGMDNVVRPGTSTINLTEMIASAGEAAPVVAVLPYQEGGNLLEPAGDASAASKPASRPASKPAAPAED